MIRASFCHYHFKVFVWDPGSHLVLGKIFVSLSAGRMKFDSAPPLCNHYSILYEYLNIITIDKTKEQMRVNLNLYLFQTQIICFRSDVYYTI